jgi:hypothetical protein
MTVLTTHFALEREAPDLAVLGQPRAAVGTGRSTTAVKVVLVGTDVLAIMAAMALAFVLRTSLPGNDPSGAAGAHALL